MKQPKFSVTNLEILKKYPESLKVNGDSSSTIIGIVGDEFKTKSGNSMIPIKLYQTRADVGSNAGENAESSMFFRGWGASILSNIENVDKSIFESMDFKEGQVLEGWNLQLSYRLSEPFYEDQEYLINPNTGEAITSNGEFIYRNVITVKGKPQHQGLDIPRDQSISAKVESGVSLEELF
jgi:hypothetical protein